MTIAAAKSTARFASNPLILGILTAMGPLAIDLYLPAFPALTIGLHASEGEIQASLVAFFATLALGQLAYGPISDAVGRRPPLIVGLILFLIASLGCALAPNIESLIVLRAVQGLGACACSTLPRAIVRDQKSGPDAARLLSTMFLVFGVSPLFAPTLGGVLLNFGGWRTIFYSLAALVVACLATTLWLLPETHPKGRRTTLAFAEVLSSYATLLRDKRFVFLTLASASWSGATFTYLTTSSFVYMQHFGFSAFGYGVTFGVCASGMIAASQFNAYLMRKIGARKQLAWVTLAAMSISALLCTATALGQMTAPVLMVGVFLLFSCQGMAIAPSSVTALDRHGDRAGAAAALMGALQMAMGSVVSGLVSALFAPSLATLVVTQLVCLTAAAIASRLAFRGEGRVKMSA